MKYYDQIFQEEFVSHQRKVIVEEFKELVKH